MKPEQQRIAIAEAVGLDVSKRVSWRSQWEGIPDYCNDLNAMHEAEKIIKIDAFAWRVYTDELWAFLSVGDGKFRGDVHATAAHRAEAFLRTIGKWEDGA